MCGHSLTAQLEQRVRDWSRQFLVNYVAIEAVDQLGLGLGGELGRGDPAGKCFKHLVDNSLHRVGIFQQHLEHPRPVRDFRHLVTFT